MNDCLGHDDFWIIKLNAKGEEEWQRTIGGSGQEKLQSIKQTKDGGYIIGGSSSSYESNDKKNEPFGNLDYWVIKIDNKGKTEWEKQYGGVYIDELRSIEQTFDGGYIVGGYSNSITSGNKTQDNFGIGDYWILKLDLKGEIQWQKTLGGDQDEQPCVVHQIKTKEYIVGGNSNSESSNSKSRGNESGTDFWVLKMSENGDVIWEETYNFGKVDVLTSVVENDDSSFLLGGYAQSEKQNYKSKINFKKVDEEGINDFIALKINPEGQELWRRTVGSKGDDLLKKVIETRDGGYLMAGTSNPETFVEKSDNNNLLSNINGDNQKFSNVKNDLNNTIGDEKKEYNDNLNSVISDGSTKVKDGIGINNDSPIKVESNSINPVNLPLMGNTTNLNNTEAGRSEKKLRSSRDKKINYGLSDFWIVKLKDKTKPEKVKVSIEAFPNPTQEFTNIVIGYDFVKGTATVVDLAGHVLQQFEIKNRIVPIDLSSYTEGIYIVNIKTNIQSDGVKIIKGISKK